MTSVSVGICSRHCPVGIVFTAPCCVLGDLQLAMALHSDPENSISSCNDWVRFTTNRFLRISIRTTPRVYITSCAVFTVTSIHDTNLLLVVVDEAGGSCFSAAPVTPGKAVITHDLCTDSYNSTDARAPACPPPLLTVTSPVAGNVACLKACFACTLNMTLADCRAKPECLPRYVTNRNNISLYTGCALANVSSAVDRCPVHATSCQDDAFDSLLITTVVVCIVGAVVMALLVFFVVKARLCLVCRQHRARRFPRVSARGGDGWHASGD